MTSTEDQRELFLTRKGRQTHDRIVAAAADLMFDQGVAATTMSQVQQVSGVGSSQIYHYFTDKQSLVHAVIHAQIQTIMDTHKPRLLTLDSMEALRAWRDFTVEFQVDTEFRGSCPLVGLVSELGETDERARLEILAGYEQWQAAIRDGLSHMRDIGSLDSDANPEYLAMALLTAYQGGLVMTQARRDTVALETVLDTVIAQIEAYVPD